MRYAILLLTIFSLSCTGVRAPKTGRADPYGTVQYHFATEELRRDTAISSPILGRDEAGLLIVTVPVRSAIDKNLYVDYRTTFLDSTGQVVQQTGWLSTKLEANTPQRLTVNSTTMRATDFQMDFRYSR